MSNPTFSRSQLKLIVELLQATNTDLILEDRVLDSEELNIRIVTGTFLSYLIFRLTSTSEAEQDISDNLRLCDRPDEIVSLYFDEYLQSASLVG